jgi:trigger factor
MESRSSSSGLGEPAAGQLSQTRGRGLLAPVLAAALPWHALGAPGTLARAERTAAPTASSVRPWSGAPRSGFRYPSAAMQITTSPAPKSTILVEVEVPAERLAQAVGEATRALSRRTKVPGFRPGKAPRGVLEAVLGHGAVLEEAVDRLVQSSYRDALIEKEILPLTNADVEIVQAEEGKPLIFKATVPIRPEVALGDYTNFNFRPEIETTDEHKVDKVIEELRDQNASLSPVEDRGAKKGDYAVIKYEGTRDGVPFEGGSAERMPLIIGEDRLIPGFEDELVGLTVGDTKGFDITFPADYGEESLAGQKAHFEVEVRELREKILPDPDDDFARSMGDFTDLANLREEVKKRLERNALDKARHTFSDQIIEYAIANATIDLPDVLVEQEVEVMHDEFRSALARQGISDEAYAKVSGKTHEELHADFRPDAEKRVKVLLVLSKIAEVENLTIGDADVDAEIAKGKERYAGDQKLTKYFESERGRNYIRSTLRRSRVVEKLVDDWLAAHPEHPAIPHVEDGPADTIDDDQARSVAAVGATDPGSILDPDGHDHDHSDHHHHSDHDHDHDPAESGEPAPAG